MKALYFIVIMLFAIQLTACGEGGGDSGSNSTTASGVGSTAAMVVQNGFLLTLDRNSIRSFKMKEDGRPELVSKGNIFEAETLFTQGTDLVLVGTKTGAQVLRIDDKGVLSFVSIASHTRSCDPVVANDTHMFVTLRSGSGCGTVSNVLQIYNVENMDSPVLVSESTIEEPKGLALYGESLYVCYFYGLKKFDISDPALPVEVADYVDLQCNDLIILDNGRAFLTSDAGVYLTDLSVMPPVIESSILQGQ